MDRGFNELERFLNQEIATKKQELSIEKDPDARDNKNLFSRVVLASQLEGSAGLSHEEIRGNVFIYLFAGVSSLARSFILCSLIELLSTRLRRMSWYQHWPYSPYIKMNRKGFISILCLWPATVIWCVCCPFSHRIMYARVICLGVQRLQRSQPRLALLL